MMKTRLFAAFLLLAAAGVAEAGGQPGSIGLGAEAQLSGLNGVSMNYDAGDFHVGAFFGFVDPGMPETDAVVIGGRFFYHLHSTTSSDFGVGGTIGIDSQNTPGDRDTLLYLEPGFQIRMFVASNVALSFNAGVTIGVMDAEAVGVGGQLTGGAGVHYYFF